MKTFPHLTVFAFLAVLTVGCVDSLGGNGYVSFSDETREPGFSLRSGVNQPIAEGAQLRVRVSEGSITPSQVTTDDTSVLSVTSTESIIDSETEQIDPHNTRLILKAGNAGRTNVNVKLGNGTLDFYNMEVKAIADASIEFYPWDSLIPLNPNLWSNGMSMLPDANVTVFGRMRDIEGRKLTGAKALTWNLSTVGDASIKPDETNDFAVLNSGQGLGDNTLAFGNSDTYTIPTITETDVDRMEILFPIHNGSNIFVGESIILHVALYTADGRYVVGIGSEAVTFEAEGAVEFDKLIDPDGDDTADGLDSTQLERAYRVGRATDVRSDEPGSYTITARWGDLVTSTIIHVAAHHSPSQNNDQTESEARDAPQ